MNRRRGVSLPEVLIAMGVMTVLFVPVMFMFLTSAGRAGQDVREVRAAMFALEIIEQVVGVHRIWSCLAPFPLDNWSDTDKEREIDLDELAKQYPGSIGFPLWTSAGFSYGSRIVLSPAVSNFKRCLSIAQEKVGKNRGSLLSTPGLFRVTARVYFKTPVAGGEVVKSVRLTTMLSTDSLQMAEDYLD